MIMRARTSAPRKHAEPTLLPHEPGFWDELALLRIVGTSERSWEDLARRAPFRPEMLGAAVDAMVEGGMLAVRSLDGERAAFSLTARGQARLREIIGAFGERGRR